MASKEIAITNATKMMEESDAFVLMCVKENQRAMVIHAPPDYMLRIMGAMTIGKAEILASLNYEFVEGEDDYEKD